MSRLDKVGKKLCKSTSTNAGGVLQRNLVDVVELNANPTSSRRRRSRRWWLMANCRKSDWTDFSMIVLLLLPTAKGKAIKVGDDARRWRGGYFSAKFTRKSKKLSASSGVLRGIGTEWNVELCKVNITWHKVLRCNRKESLRFKIRLKFQICF